MNIKKIIKRSIGLFSLNLCLVINTFSQIPLVYDVENRGAACTPPPLPAVAQLTSYAMLPDPFAWSNGSGRISSFEDWSCRRNEIKQEVERYEIGIKPPKPANITASYTAGVLTVKVTENGKTLTLTSNVTMPTGTGPFPVVIGMNARTGQLPTNLFNGVIQIPFNHDQVARYTQGTRDASYPFFQLYPNLTSNGYYSAWSWGISRLIDGIEIVKAQMNADTKRIAVTGCSYAGKMALFAGAFDERVALTIAQESGGGGVNSWRVSETIGNVEKIGNTNYSWFMQSMQTNFQNGNAVKLPYDHHELMAMIAPRALLVLGNPPFEWLGDESGYVSSRAAQEVWNTLGVPERFGFSFRGGHDHCSLPTASNSEVTVFVDKFLRNITTANTNIAVHSFPNTDYNKWITAWKGYVIAPANVNSPVVTVTAPLTNTSYTEGDNITINATATITTGSISKVEFFQGTKLLSTVTTAPYTYTWTNAPAGKYQITAKATSAAATTGISSIINVLVTKAIFQISTSPTIDGAIDAVWATYTAVPITNVLSGTVASAVDLSGNWKAMWDATNLYVLVQVTDDVKRNDAGNDVYNDDGVEIYVDFGNHKPIAYGANDHQYTFRWNDATAAYEINSHPVTGIVKGMVNTTTGYVMEISIPWTTIGGVPTANSLQGFDVMINDDDNGAARDKKMAWFATTDDTWDNPSLMGTIVLKALNCTPPAATVTAVGTTTVCTGGAVVLNANINTGLSYVWKKDNVVISGATLASYTANATGSYTLTVTSGACSAVSTATIVTVNALPTTPIVTSTVAYCQGATATQLTATGIALKWYANNTTTTALVSAPTPTTTGTGTTNYFVSQSSNGCESSRAQIAVTVNALPNAPIVTGAVSYCQGATATQLTATGTALKWYANNTTAVVLASAPIPATSATGTVNYFVSQSTNGCESSRAQIAVTVKALPTTPIVTSTVAYCQGATPTQLTATGIALKWYANNTTTTALLSVPNPVTTEIGTINYFVSQSTNGCESSRAQIAVTVNALPNATITPVGSTTIATGGSVVLNANTSFGFTYKWLNGLTEVGTDASYLASLAGSYVVEITNNSGCMSKSLPTVVYAASNQPSIITITSPTPNTTIVGTITIDVNVSDPDGTIKLVEYLDGNIVIGSSTSQPYSFDWKNPSIGNHVITVRVTDSNDGITTSALVAVIAEQSVVTTGITTGNNVFANIYPIPARDKVTIETGIDLVGARINVVNALGQEVAVSVNILEKNATLYVSGLSAGTYILLINKDSNIISKKISVVN